MHERREREAGDRDAALWLARCMVEQKRSDEAVSLLRAEVERSPDALAAAAELGRLLLREGREAEALKSFEELLEHLPVDRHKLQCQSCGTQDAALHWRCPQCGEWDSFV